MDPKTFHSRRRGDRGFALVVTIAMMVLMALLALSTVSLRASSQGLAMSKAREFLFLLPDDTLGLRILSLPEFGIID